MSTAHAVAAAVSFTWLGMVIAISFIEAPLKFRAPGVSLQIGLGIGRLVFRALNTVEAVLAVVLLIVLVADPPSPTAAAAVSVVVVALAAQLLVVRPRLARRSDVVLAGPAAAHEPGQPTRRSRVHYSYVGLELVKIAALVISGAAALAGA
ncbi:hypothetical protein BST22_17010 [Mycolicibacterium chubuense]|uniref:Transmembrane protein n=1 Tax=Mycolicibacterium chubuense TaxID=1800 RepID=A0A0J6WR51_MYCCU|nr:hypothetical protein [Mycolicibacterium chubuense]KMO84222.1 hypothetical protein MCHUDSM44219_00814 [Mycolicibacterium chubuense]ORA49775.1 hypothetical protein BST22_17010 [Mycolicibacterium chubuense]SPX99965.1 transmembrane protein [Mycolicibacterium chubuense]